MRFEGKVEQVTAASTTTLLLEDAAFGQSAAESIQALAAPSRLRILARLHTGPASVADLLEQVVSHVEHVRLGLAGRRQTAESATG